MTAAAEIHDEFLELCNAIEEKVAQHAQQDQIIIEADAAYEAALEEQVRSPRVNTMLKGQKGYEARKAGRDAREKQADLSILLERLYERKRVLEAQRAVAELVEITKKFGPVHKRILKQYAKGGVLLAELVEQSWLELGEAWRAYGDLRQEAEPLAGQVEQAGHPQEIDDFRRASAPAMSPMPDTIAEFVGQLLAGCLNRNSEEPGRATLRGPLAEALPDLSAHNRFLRVPFDVPKAQTGNIVQTVRVLAEANERQELAANPPPPPVLNEADQARQDAAAAERAAANEAVLARRKQAISRMASPDDMPMVAFIDHGHEPDVPDVPADVYRYSDAELAQLNAAEGRV